MGSHDKRKISIDITLQLILVQFIFIVSMTCPSQSSMSRRVDLVRFRNRSSRVSDVKRRANNVWKNVLDDICDQCSLHGLNHIIRNDRSTVEKAFWTMTVMCAVLFATYAIVESWKTYNKSSIDTVVETTFLSYAKIAFPMVVICDSSRVDWERVMRLTPRDVPGTDPDLLPAVRKVLKTFSVMSYGDFDDFDELWNVTELSKLNHLNLTALLLKVMRPCNEVFCCGGCWWKFKQVNCCDIFELQRTEFGLCHSFNSDFSEYGRVRVGVTSGLIGTFWQTESGEFRPRTTDNKGQWSGVRMYISTMSPEQVAPNVNAKPSIRILMGEPKGAPLGSDMVVMAGNFGNINVWGDRIYNTHRTKRLSPKQRNCYFGDESPTGMGTNYYLRRNCRMACYMFHMVNECGCYLEAMFGLMKKNDSLRPCNAEDLLCLSKNNQHFNNYIPFVQTSFFTKDKPGLKCECMPDCVHQMYIPELTIAEQTVSSMENSSSSILIDLHFKQSACILYRSDLILGWLDLLVSFGGCAGLFLGGSLLSFIELIYFLTWRVYYHWRRTPPKSVKSKRNKKGKGHRIVRDTWTMDDFAISKTWMP
ncbi:pickpocket protein 19-like [Metopolophium dirhodum]|uniref:pickpocket protein 19-like n=1 Tax=Metopolophium dirhodum TaxID=44670 RepID=UPI0029907815|nr:pickpocket protein 19-like [Metopolophium dirhodum]